MIVESHDLVKESDYVNFGIIDNLVSNHFSLRSDSLEYFKKELYNPRVASEINDIFSKGKSTRIYIKLSDEILSQMDTGFEIFSNYFGYFMRENDIKFENFKNNIIEKNGNKIKIKKVLKKYSEDLTNELLDSLLLSEECVSVKEEVMSLITEIDTEDIEKFEEIIYPIKNKKEINSYVSNFVTNFVDDKDTVFSNKIYGLLSRIVSFVISSIISDIDNDLLISEKLRKEIKARIVMSIKNDLVWSVSERYEEMLRIASNKKITKDSLYLVLSINYADWFLCSTSENWGSCLNLEGDMLYWYGLPGLIGDKNRMLIYLTTGEKKEYKGIEVDKIITRAWTILNSNGKFNTIRWYPNSDFNSKCILEKASSELGIEFEEEVSDEYFITKYPLELVFNYDNKGIFIYLDYSGLKRNYDDNSNSSIFIEYKRSGSIQSYVRDSNGDISLLNDVAYNDDDESFQKLSHLIDSESDFLAELSQDYFYCSNCEDRIADDDDRYVLSGGESICGYCERNYYSTCTSCEDLTHDNYIETDGENEPVCTFCLESDYFTCDLSNSYFRNEHICSYKETEYGQTLNSTHDILRENGYLMCNEDNIYYKEFLLTKDEDGDNVLISSCVQSEAV